MSNWIKAIAIITIVCVFCGCGDSNKEAASSGLGTLTDAMGRQVTIPTSAKRIVSMAPNITEMLFALGLEQEIVGVTDFCDYPDAAKKKTKIGGYHTPNIEAILSLTPDLVVATPDGYSKENVERLDESGLSVFVVDPKDIDEILETMLTLGKVTGRDNAAKKVVNGLRLRVEAVRQKVAAIPTEKWPKVFYEIGTDPLVTAGPGNFVDSLISAAGGVNVANDAHTDWPRYSVEAVIMKEPDIIITAPHTASLDSLADTWHKYRTIPAVQNSKIHGVDPDILLRSGPRIVDGLEKLHSLFTED